MPDDIRVLVVDDKPVIRKNLKTKLDAMGCISTVCATVAEGLKEAGENEFDIAFVDWKLEGDAMDGIGLVAKIRNARDMRCVVYSRDVDPQTAERKILAWELDDVILAGGVEDLVDRLRPILARLRREKAIKGPEFCGIVGQSPAMLDVYERVARVGPSETTVLVRGKSGTGKELVARAILRMSRRATAPFVEANIGGLAETTLDSALFGHEKGAFTDAHEQRKGRFEIADGGTIFLDEIGDLSPASQVKLLRVLQERRFERVGGTTPIPVDIRVIAATHQNLEEMMANGTFREDLYYRLNVFPIELVRLCERVQDIPLLVRKFLEEFSQKANRPVSKIADGVTQFLQRYPWPGNVRELRNVIEHAILNIRGDELRVEHLPEFINKPQGLPNSCWSIPRTANLKEAVDALRTEMFKWALEQTRGNKTRAAELLEGIDRPQLSRECKC